MNRRQMLFAALGLAAGGGPALGAAVSDVDYETVFYKSGKLNIEAYLYRPDGAGPFPLVIYNHGTRQQDTAEVPFRFVGDRLRYAGYAVLVPERRGYGKSDGTSAHGANVVSQLEEEADDVLASLDYIRTLAFVDPRRIGIMGWSFGGIVTLFAAAKSDAFRCAIDQAGGALSWTRSADLRRAIPAAAAKIKVPVYFMDSENDATTDAVKASADAMIASGVPHQLKIYPAFTPAQNPSHEAPGHLIFAAGGIDIWASDAIAFLDAHLKSS